MFGLNERGKKENYGMNEFGQIIVIKKISM
jgi:hypothetical protein